jgi:hypothetical protein
MKMKRCARRAFTFWRPYVCIYVDMWPDLGSLEPAPTPHIPPRRGGVAKPTRHERRRKPLPLTRLDHVSYQLRLFGGRVVDSLNEEVTHVVVDPEAPERLDAITKRLRLLRRRPSRFERRVVAPAWIDACQAAGHIVEPQSQHVISSSV